MEMQASLAQFILVHLLDWSTCRLSMRVTRALSDSELPNQRPNLMKRDSEDVTGRGHLLFCLRSLPD